MRKSHFVKSVILVLCLAFLAILAPALGDLSGKDKPAVSALAPVGSNGGLRPALDTVELKAPR